MMKLHSRIQLKELTDEPARFNFLKGLKKQINRIDEVHPTEESDNYFIFLIWLKDGTNEDRFVNKVIQNFRHANDWDFRVHSARTGFVTVHTWT